MAPSPSVGSAVVEADDVVVADVTPVVMGGREVACSSALESAMLGRGGEGLVRPQTTPEDTTAAVLVVVPAVPSCLGGNIRPLAR